MKKILIVNNTLKPCGVQEWGERLRYVLKNSERYTFIYREVTSASDIANILEEVNPNIALYNYNPCTLPYVTTALLSRFRQIKHVAIIHEGYSDKNNYAGFDFFIYLMNNVEAKPNVFSTDVRYLLDYTGLYPINAVTTVGSFGFGFSNKRFDYIVETVNREFDTANIRFQMSRSIHGDPYGKLNERTIEQCRSKITKPGIKLSVNQEFITDEKLLEFLAGNDINCFFYDDSKVDGLAGSLDLALSVKRPIAITRVPMLSHIYSLAPSICIENSTLKQILWNDVKPLQPLYTKFSSLNFNAELKKILDSIEEIK